ncbi:MAG: DNA repair protein RecN [Sphaerochaetaceae bacterium]|nr:DNA repair protein RecN [Sphaerochaetaceae bacterium]
MLEHLEIRNFALIEELSADFHEGFNVITGETGAGKSIILGALGLLMGERADSSAIRTGADEMTVNAVISIPDGHEAYMWLRDHDMEAEDGAIVVKRTVKRNGRSLVSVQGQIVTRSELTELAETMIDMHGQSEHQSLLSSDRQRRVLDFYSKNNSLLQDVSDLSKKISNLLSEYENTKAMAEEGRRQQDYLSFALNEIKDASLTLEEEDEIREKVSVFSHFEQIYENLSISTDKLKEASHLLHDASSFTAKAAKLDSSLTDFTARLESLRIEQEDISEGLRDYLNNVDFSEEALNLMQDRLALIQKLKRKYGPTVSDVLAFAASAEEKLNLCEDSEYRIGALEKELETARSLYKKASDVLFMSRKKNAGVLEKAVEETLRTLGMPQCRFEIPVEHDENKVSSNGSDSVKFFISANPGEPLKEMREIASGGELSRVMLALKAVLSDSDDIQTQVFDEVDSGIGGSVALRLSACLKDLSRRKQVIAITHLASIASKADSQFVVRKSVENGRTYTHLEVCEGENRVHEIARMLSGDEEELTLSHARSLLAEDLSTTSK